MNRIVFISTLLLLASCGREATYSEVKMVGVGMDPESIEPVPTKYGGTVELTHIDFAGAGLTSGLLGFVSYDEIGPAAMSWSPPYEAVRGFSYIFDTQLSISSMSSIAPTGPSAPDTCLTLIEPSGPIGSFTTVDVGDYMNFFTDDGRGLTLGRFPTDYPPDPQGLFIYYQGVEGYRPETMTHMVPDPANPGDPAAMIEKPYRRANYPFGEEVFWSFPGGFSDFVEPVASIPLPSTHAETNSIMLPSDLGGVMLEWNGPRYDHLGEVVGDGEQRHCMEFYGDGRDGVSEVTDCDQIGPLPTSQSQFDDFPGQMYTAPWDTTDDQLTLKWTPDPDGGDTVGFTLRFLAEIEYDDDYLVRPVVNYGTEEDRRERQATPCEEGEAEVAFDYTSYAATDENDRPIQNEDGSWKPGAGLQGDPNSRMAEVVCTLEDDGEFTIDHQTMIKPAYDYVNQRQRKAGGVIFIFARTQSAEATIPAAKDQYDQRHEISPVLIQAASARVGRMWWDNNPADGE